MYCLWAVNAIGGGIMLQKKISILIIEDDNDINNLLKSIVVQNGYTATQAFSGTEGLLHVERDDFDLILMDLMLPGLCGEELLIKIRANKCMPIIVLSAKTEKSSKLEVLQSGADDYITKPFDIDEVGARINAQLRRFIQFQTPLQNENSYTFENLCLNSDTREVFFGESPIALTAHEFDILQLFMKYPKKVFTRSNIFEQVWGDEFMSDENTVNVHISNLRQKLATASGHNEFIITVWGVGFKLSK